MPSSRSSKVLGHKTKKIFHNAHAHKYPYPVLLLLLRCTAAADRFGLDCIRLLLTRMNYFGLQKVL